jgi:demethylmenaquinone methyltransferase/2-methoxy-6-polyprenyl-1,4-benzoquinol methylase
MDAKKLNFDNEFFDIVMLSSILHHIDENVAKNCFKEIHRVLKKNGRWVIVDLGKPDEPLIRFGVAFYLRMILPIIAFIAGGRLGLKFATLYGTYKRWPQNKKLESLLLEKFSRVEFEKDLMGGAIMVAAYK